VSLLMAACLALSAPAEPDVDASKLEEKLAELVRVYESKFPGNSPEKAAALTKAAEMYREIRKPEKAVPLYEKVLAIQKASEKQPSLERVETLAELSTSYAAVGRYPEAIAATTESIAILRQHYPAENGALYSSMNNLATLYLGAEKYDQAEKALQDMLALAASLKPKKASIAATHHNLGLLYFKTKDFKKSEKSLLQALSLKQQAFGKSHPQVGLTLSVLSQLYAQLGASDKAAKMKAQAVKTIGRDPAETP
jgi:tetratricopeptide (TPR) repeat protein